jgi:hypothetical protein
VTGAGRYLDLPSFALGGSVPSTLSVPVATRIYHDDVAALRQFAQEHDTTPSAVLAQLVREYITLPRRQARQQPVESH